MGGAYIWVSHLFGSFLCHSCFLLTSYLGVPNVWFLLPTVMSSSDFSDALESMYAESDVTLSSDEEAEQQGSEGDGHEGEGGEEGVSDGEDAPASEGVDGNASEEGEGDAPEDLLYKETVRQPCQP